jgi:hypothetical protein
MFILCALNSQRIQYSTKTKCAIGFFGREDDASRSEEHAKGLLGLPAADCTRGRRPFVLGNAGYFLQKCNVNRQVSQVSE